MRSVFSIVVALAVLITAASDTVAEIRTKVVTYNDGDVVLEGFVAWDSELEGKKSPGILISHQWMGLTDYEKGRCEQLAELGYVAFALDIYGKDNRPENRGEA